MPAPSFQGGYQAGDPASGIWVYLQAKVLSNAQGEAAECSSEDSRLWVLHSEPWLADLLKVISHLPASVV